MKAILAKKGMTIEDYLVKLLKGAIPFDEGAILLFGRATGLHFGVILNDEFWCTNYDNDCEKWSGLMMYCGNLKFLDTTPGDMELAECYELLNLNAFGLPHGSSPQPSSPNPSTLNSPSHSSQATVTVSENDSDEEYLPPSKKRRKQTKSRVRQLLAKVRKPVTRRRSRTETKSHSSAPKKILSKMEDPPARCTRSSKQKSAAEGTIPATHENSETSTAVDNNTDKSDKTDKSIERQTETDKSIPVNGDADKADKSMEPQTETDKSIPVNGDADKADKSIEPQTETDKSIPVNGDDDKTDKSIEAETKTDKSSDVDNTADKSKTENNSDKSTNETDKSDAITNGATNTTGHLEVKSYGIKKSVTKERRHKCQHCDKTFGFVKELNAHTREEHADKPFKCHLCDRTYSSKNALDRHAKVHTGLPFVCGQCPFACQFRYEMRDHLKKHTGTQKWPCPRNDCNLSFSSKRGLNQHMAVHTPDQFNCEHCPKTFNTRGYLRQHLHYHTGGFPTYCGFKAKNPTAKQLHQKTCDDCKQKKPSKLILATAKEKNTLEDLDSSSSSSSGSSTSAASTSSSSEEE